MQLEHSFTVPAGIEDAWAVLLDIERIEGRFTELLAWIRERLSDTLSVEQLADKSNMSPRNFARAFAAETGITPAKAVERLRLEAARALVEADIRPLNAIARETGFGDVERMRRAFIRAFGQPPQSLRRAARAR